jgi:hypothetical protein
MKYMMFITLALVLSACGPDITWHRDATEEQIIAIHPLHISAYGVSTRTKRFGQLVSCDIYMRAAESGVYRSEECYHVTENHELRHCYEGEFHKNSNDLKDYPDMLPCHVGPVEYFWWLDN